MLCDSYRLFPQRTPSSALIRLCKQQSATLGPSTGMAETQSLSAHAEDETRQPQALTQGSA